MTNTTSALNGLFNPLEGPQISQLETEQDEAVLSLGVASDLRWFDGHFPQQKVLPGVVQIDWAGKLAKALFVDGETFTQLTNIKFKTMVLPDTAMQLKLTHKAAKGIVAFHFFNDTDSFSQGSFKFIAS